ncbi:hypothetical protein D9758_010754 [Tetrapyrgos nigripes]|uniref:BTB domain-containing protein n=1 Tax=Tetrapyrgos nigripes TaxID=182062 RepID=A0A8H5D6E7_9AGAR|nr:hypothetical protein D9758_010754 [Tetrapyrgos nigripes]
MPGSPKKKQRLEQEAEAEISTQSHENMDEVDNVNTSVGPSNTVASEPASTPRLIMHEKHWALDGNVIIRISNVQFRLIRSILAKKSEWFRNAFNSDNDEQQEMYNGLPVYVLDDVVRLRDFERLLDALDDIVNYVHQPPPFPVFASILRTAHALDFRDLKLYFERELMKKWLPPGSRFEIAGSDEKNEEKDENKDEKQEADDSLIDYLKVAITYPSTSILLSQECNIPSILPRAFYELVALDTFGLEGHHFTSGGTEGSDSERGCVEDKLEDEEKEAKLSEDLYYRLLRARNKLTNLWTADITTPPEVTAHKKNDKSQKSKSTSSCSAQSQGLDLKKYVHCVMKPRGGKSKSTFSHYIHDPLAGLNEILNTDWEKQGYCKKCVEERKKAWRKMMKSWWEEFQKNVMD